MGFKRKGSRVEVGRAGRLQRGTLSAPCKVLDVSETGVKIESRLFVKTGDALCFSCHETMKKLQGKKSVHAPFAGGDCDTCHAPHAGDRAALLEHGHVRHHTIGHGDVVAHIRQALQQQENHVVSACLTEIL